MTTHYDVNIDIFLNFLREVKQILNIILSFTPLSKKQAHDDSVVFLFRKE